MSDTQRAAPGTTLEIMVQAMDDAGAHIALTTLNTSVLSTHTSSNPVVTEISDGTGGVLAYRLTWSGLNPALVAGDIVYAIVKCAEADDYAVRVDVVAPAADVSGLSTFDPTADEVTTDAASRTASQADVSGLATAAELAKTFKTGDTIKHAQSSVTSETDVDVTLTRTAP